LKHKLWENIEEKTEEVKLKKFKSQITQKNPKKTRTKTQNKKETNEERFKRNNKSHSKPRPA
jgi:hypothetical protein